MNAAIVLSLHERDAIKRAGGIRAWDKLKAQTYAALSLQDASEAAEAALGLSDQDLRRNVLLHLASHVPGSLATVQRRLVDLRVVYPGELYWKAGAETRDALLEAVAQSHGVLSANHLLLCLAWIGDAGVQASFAQWRRSPPPWASALHVPPHAYAAEAGWELTDSGDRRDLCTLVSARLEKSDDGEIAVAMPSGQPCPWLERPLTNLLDAPTTLRPLSWLAGPFERLRILTCDQSTCFTHVFCELDAHGNAAWSQYNTRPAFLGHDGPWKPLPSARMSARSSLATPFWGHAFVWNGGASKLGGFPSWVQDADYPTCPTCGRHMCFVGQVETNDLREHSEGIYFAFLCADCKVGATAYQQT